MSDVISSILQWINAHPHLAGLATFIISAAESIAIIGTIVPGTVMMTAIGTLAGSGVMPLWSTIVWAILGAIVGDGISYWLGYYFKDRIRQMWPFRSHPYLLTSGERFFHKYGSMSVFIGRFVGPVRALVPLVAGMLGMKPLRFTIANVTSAIGWAPAYMLPGIALGAASLELPPDLAAHALLMLLLVTLFIILCIWIIKQIISLISNQVNNVLTKVWLRLHRSRFLSPVTVALRHYDPQKTYGQLTRAFYFLLVFCFFLYLATYIYYSGSQDIFINKLFFSLFRSFRSSGTDTFMLNLTLLGESKILLPVFFGLFLWMILNKRWHTAWHVLALGILTAGSVETFKHIVHSQRPWGIAHSPTSMSFPSGHATFALTFYLGAALLIVRGFKQHYRILFYTLAWLLIIGICISRVYLGAHWVTDTLGGILLGGSVLILVVLSYNRRAEKELNPLGIIAVIVLLLGISYSTYHHRNFETLRQNSLQIDWPIKTVTLSSWWNQTGGNSTNNDLPLYRLNRFGLSTQILNLQWLSNLDSIHNTLLQNGWQISPARDWITILHRISDVQSTEHLPVVSPLYLDKEPVLVLIKEVGKKLVVLRLWNPNVSIQNVNQTLWVGTVESVPRTYSWLFNRNRSNDINLNTSLLFKKVPDKYDIKVIKVRNTHRHRAVEQPMVLIKPQSL
jgi:undecaprenyl-diphosphatase